MSSSFISPNSLKLGPFSKFSSTVAPKVSRGLPFLKTFAKGLRFAPGIRIGTGLLSGTSRLLSGEPLHKVGMGYAQAIPGPIGWSAVAADLADQAGVFSNMSGGNPASNFTGGLPNTSPSQGPQISNIGETPPEFQVGGKYGPSEEALIDLADQETLYNQKGEYTGGVLPEGDGIDHRATWLHKTRNSPAARSGSFTNEERWQTQLANQQWRKDNNRSFNYGEFLN